MGAVEAQRTLVKSLPEVWAQLTEQGQLAPLLDDAFGEIRITRLVAEESIEWEGALARGVVELVPSGFGTRVRLTAEIAHAEPPEPEPAPEPEPQPRFLARLLRRFRRAAPAAEPAPPPEPVPAIPPAVAEQALCAFLDEVGTPRHRPFSRDRGAPPIT